MLGGALGTRGYYASAQDAAAGILTVSQEQQQTWVRNFNPFLPESSACRWPTHAGIYEPMMIYNPMAGVWTPWLATAFTWSPDLLQLRFALRPGVRWSDGAPFTSADVVFTF